MGRVKYFALGLFISLLGSGAMTQTLWSKKWTIDSANLPVKEANVFKRLVHSSVEEGFSELLELNPDFFKDRYGLSVNQKLTFIAKPPPEKILKMLGWNKDVGAVFVSDETSLNFFFKKLVQKTSKIYFSDLLTSEATSAETRKGIMLHEFLHFQEPEMSHDDLSFGALEKDLAYACSVTVYPQVDLFVRDQEFEKDSADSFLRSCESCLRFRRDGQGKAYISDDSQIVSDARRVCSTRVYQ